MHRCAHHRKLKSRIIRGLLLAYTQDKMALSNLARRSGSLAAYTRPFTSSATRFVPGTHGHSDDPKEVEEEKQKQLRGETKSSLDHIPGWSEKLASDSEAAIKSGGSQDPPEFKRPEGQKAAS
ncbi:uncharacterized protein L969DRAFT_94743 [Mixia osmundae IAM 14324]|uniref:Uncharacterized protein n=1 Tax=Mixia osmundae (strain CBS 9802 / IAM 14324 / JCM 22182 / KY 12970) TaxID=764103 RepID=G7E441_MIXOS|nr:uncharacterized protein L969DRAFT_94743 [Mixia osmundae IAM 14324]KEI39696.1 hypothetical protein L969DRAFT_94743 [Mixia osmundae IAM 14324]GAA97601.1 hypothetical protein E5Q_04279 [Mixia osmundae IAM 14324]